MPQPLLGDICRSEVRLEARLQVLEWRNHAMDLSPREVAFLKSEMNAVADDETRQPTARVEAGRIREKAESVLTE